MYIYIYIYIHTYIYTYMADQRTPSPEPAPEPVPVFASTQVRTLERAALRRLRRPNVQSRLVDFCNLDDT